jgi:hypothetical protein
MLQAKNRTFKAKGLAVKQLKQHVNSRFNAVIATTHVRWKFGHDSGFNANYWSDALGSVKSDAAAVVNDMFANPATYTRGCKATARIVLLKGVLDTIGASEFNSAIGTGQVIDLRALSVGLLRDDKGFAPDDSKGSSPLDWVPGDAGYVRGENRDPLLRGEWIIYRRGSGWWGFGFGNRTLSEWRSLVKEWPGADPTFEPVVTAERLYSGVGLEK